jgi:hypothetical protein
MSIPEGLGSCGPATGPPNERRPVDAVTSTGPTSRPPVSKVLRGNLVKLGANIISNPPLVVVGIVLSTIYYGVVMGHAGITLAQDVFHAHANELGTSAFFDVICACRATRVGEDAIAVVKKVYRLMIVFKAARWLYGLTGKRPPF